jgi:hypothetical protein
MLIAEIPAAVAASVMFVNVMPFSLDPKLNPWVMFLAALLILSLPLHFVLALAMTIPMGLIYGWTGIRLQGHAPVKLPVGQVVSVAKRLKVPKKIEIRDILQTEFPNPSVEKYVPEL